MEALVWLGGENAFTMQGPGLTHFLPITGPLPIKVLWCSLSKQRITSPIPY